MANAVYSNQGSAITWKDSGGTYAVTLSSLGSAAGRVGPRGDLGAWPHPIGYRWFATAQWAATPAANDRLEIYAAFWDVDTPADAWGGIGATDAALSAYTAVKNLAYIGSIIVESAAVGPFSAGGMFVAPARYISPVIYNQSATKALVASGTYAACFRITPIYPEVQ